MSLKSLYEMFIFTALFVWGVISFAKGAAISFFINEGDAPSSGLVIALTYSSVILVVGAGLLYARIAAFISIILSFVLFGVILASNGLAHGPDVAGTLIFAVVLRPLLAGLLLMSIPSVGPIGRLLGRKR